MLRFHPLDPAAERLLDHLGVPAHPRADADALVAASPEGCAMLRGLRAWGHTAPAVVVGAGPAHRALLEPMVVLRVPTAEGLLEAARARPTHPAGRLRLPGGVVDLGRLRFLRADGVQVPLTQREADILSYLAARPRPVTRDELQTEVWGHLKVVGRSRSVDMAIRRLRTKIEARPDDPEVLLTCWGDGYRLVLEPCPRAAPLRATEALGPAVLAWAFHFRRPARPARAIAT